VDEIGYIVRGKLILVRIAGGLVFLIGYDRGRVAVRAGAAETANLISDMIGQAVIPILISLMLTDH